MFHQNPTLKIFCLKHKTQTKFQEREVLKEAPVLLSVQIIIHQDNYYLEMCLIHFPHMLTVHGMAYHSNYCQENSIKRIISPVLIVFSLKTERIKVVILCLLWSDLSLKSSQLPLVFLSGLANQISCSHERFSFILVLGCIFVYNYLLSQKDYIFLPS